MLNNIDIYIISLETEDIGRRKKISMQMELQHFDYKFIDAINGKNLSAAEYYRLAKNPNFFFNRRHIISPSEVGCRLSHKKAILDFINNSNKEWLIIFEDDISFKESFCDFSKELNSSIYKHPTIIHLGGQEGLKTIDRVLMKKQNLDNNLNLKKVNKLTLRWLYRTCCYAINKDAARELITVHDKFTFIADDWSFILKKSNINDIFYTNHITHPIDITDSSIELERL